MRTLSALEFQHAVADDAWRVLGTGACAWFPAPTHALGAELAARVCAQSVGSRAFPDLDVRAQGVRVQLPGTKHGLEADTVERAQEISAVAAELGLQAAPSDLQELQLALDVLDPPPVMGFWRHVLGYEMRGDEDVVDPLRRNPPIWFQDQDAPRPARNRIHLDAVAPQEISTRAVADGPAYDARVASENDFYVTLADSEGNEVDVLPLPEGADRWTDDTEDWRLLFAAIACYPVQSPSQAAELTRTAAALADDAGLSLGVDIRDGLVILHTAKDAWEVDDRYPALAADVQSAARGSGLRADPTRVRFVQAVIDAVDIPAVRRFWNAALGYEDDPRDGVTDIVDPRGLGMPLVFQHLDPDDQVRRAQRNRLHLDLFVPDDQAESRIAAALAAGGRITSDVNAPFGTTIADPERNEIDIAVSVGREEA